jgi:hypothetical protein
VSEGGAGGVGRFDERDTMFARMARRAGTSAYADYYSRRPQLRKPDDRIRSMPGLGRPGGRHHHPEISAEAERYFEDIPGLELDPAVVARGARELEATDCGICMAVCPFSHRNTVFHSLVRLVVRRAPWTHRMAVWLDDLAYGRRWNPRAPTGVKEV